MARANLQSSDQAAFKLVVGSAWALICSVRVQGLLVEIKNTTSTTHDQGSYGIRFVPSCQVVAAALVACPRRGPKALSRACHIIGASVLVQPFSIQIRTPQCCVLASTQHWVSKARFV